MPQACREPARRFSFVGRAAGRAACLAALIALTESSLEDYRLLSPVLAADPPDDGTVAETVPVFCSVMPNSFSARLK